MRSLATAHWLTALAVFSGCTTTPGPRSEPAEVPPEGGLLHEELPDESVLYACKPAPGAPRPFVHVIEVVGAELDPKEHAAAHEEAPLPQPATQQGEAEIPVVIEVNHVSDSRYGHCFRRPLAGGEAKDLRFSCTTLDGKIRLDWPAGVTVPQGPATVQVREKWLFWTKSYQADCAVKPREP